MPIILLVKITVITEKKLVTPNFQKKTWSCALLKRKEKTATAQTAKICTNVAHEHMYVFKRELNVNM